jgi:hypothetical protein
MANHSKDVGAFSHRGGVIVLCQRYSQERRTARQYKEQNT